MSFSRPGVAGACFGTYIYLHYPHGRPALYHWADGRLERAGAPAEALRAWAELAGRWGHVPQPVRALTPVGEAWLAAFPGAQVTDRLLACQVGGPDVADDQALADLADHLVLAAQLAQTRHDLQFATTQLTHSGGELLVCRELGAMLRQPLPLARLQQEAARHLREALGLETLWLWPETDLRKRPVQDHGGEDPDRPVVAEARRVAESVMSSGECRSVRGSAHFLGAPLLLAGGVRGAIVGRLPAAQAAPRAEQTELLRALAAQVAVALDYSRLRQEPAGETGGAGARGADRGEMAGGLGHDLNNLLAGICLQAEVGADLAEGSEVLEQFREIRQRVLKAAQVVRRLQGLTSGTPMLPPGELVDLGELVRDLLGRHWSAWREQVAMSGGTLLLSTDFAEDLHVLGSPVELGDLTLKLVRNAVEAMPRGGELQVQLRRVDKHVVLRVRDTGVGMTPEALGRACDPFFSTKEAEHVGLGLTVARSICAGHQGHMTVASEPEAGTTVEVMLPRAEAAGGRPTAGPRAAQNQPASPALNILIADDDASFLHSMQALLRRLGHRVSAAGDGREAINLLRHGGSFDILLLDLSMPEMGGWEVAGLAGKLQPQACVLLLTGWGEQAATINDGRLDRVLAKPISLESLTEALESCQACKRPVGVTTWQGHTA